MLNRLSSATNAYNIKHEVFYTIRSRSEYVLRRHIVIYFGFITHI
jgi:hypothetical protein